MQPSIPKPPVLQYPKISSLPSKKFHARSEFKIPKCNTQSRGRWGRVCCAIHILEKGSSGIRFDNLLHSFIHSSKYAFECAAADTCLLYDSKKSLSSISNTYRSFRNVSLTSPSGFTRHTCVGFIFM